jgi:hypothetical protein
MTLAVVATAVLVTISATWMGMRVYEGRGVARDLSTGGIWAFARLTRMARWLRVRLTPAQTPYEQAQAIGRVVPTDSAGIERVAELYVQERYGRASADLSEARTLWNRLRKPIWMTGFRQRLPRWKFSLQRVRRWLR